jgi:PAS domain S-box-containing protein
VHRTPSITHATRDAQAPLEQDPVALELALAATDVGVFEYDARTGRQRFSTRCRAIWGLRDDEEPTSERIRELIHPDDRSVTEVVAASLRPDGSGEFEVAHRIVRPDGSLRWVQARGRTFFEGTGANRRPVRSLGTMLDVTERQRVERELAGTIRALQDSELRFRTIFEQTNDFVFTADLQQRITSCNPAVAAALGLSPGEAVGRSIGEFIAPEQFQRTTAMLMRKLRESGTTRYEVEVRGRDGTPLTWEVNSTLTHGPDGRPTGLHAIARDVTEQRRVRSALELSESRFRAIQETSIDGFMVLSSIRDEDGTIVDFRWEYANEAAARIVGRPRDWFAGRRLLVEMPGNRTDGLFDAYRQVVETGEALTREFTYRHEGLDVYLRMVAAQADDGFAVTFADLTEKRRTEERILRSEARLRSFADSIPALAWAADATGGVRFFNRQWYEYTGQRPDEAMPHGWQDALHPDDRPRTAAALEGAVADSGPVTIEYRLRRYDGIYRWFLARIAPESESDGRTVGWFGTATDVDDAKITEQILREQEQALRESDARLRIALDSARAGVFDWNVDLDRVEWTEGYYALLGLVPGSVPASHALWRQHVHPEDLARVESALQAALERRHVFAADYRIRGADGVERWVQGRALVLSGPGEPTRMIGALVDITERRHANDRLREADRRKDEFLATLAHELRNPLAPIRTAAHVLGAPQLSATQLASARQVIQRQVAHMAYLLDDLLDVARITRGKLEIRKTRMQLPSIVEAAIEAARPLLDAKRHSLEVELPPDVPELDADPQRIAQVLSNLLTNAAKYTDPGGHVALTARVEGAQLRIAVRDDGIGLTPTALATIFEMFSQVQDARHRSEGGLGIGLALVKGVVGLHGGTVEAHSEGTGRGSEFVVRLPLPMRASATASAPGPAPAASAAPAIAPAPAPAPARPPSIDRARSRRVLVADDNRDAADSLAMLLQLQGHDVRIASNGVAALAIADVFRPDLAILDIGMPDLSGYDVARQLRGKPWARDLRLIALTGWGQDDDQREARAAGFDHHLTKPADVARLGELIT